MIAHLENIEKKEERKSILTSEEILIHFPFSHELLFPPDRGPLTHDSVTISIPRHQPPSPLVSLHDLVTMGLFVCLEFIRNEFLAPA